MATISMNIEHRSAAARTDLVVEGWVEQRGRSIVFCRAEVRDDRGTVVAVGSTVYKVSSRTIPVSPA